MQLYYQTYNIVKKFCRLQFDASHLLVIVCRFNLLRHDRFSAIKHAHYTAFMQMHDKHGVPITDSVPQFAQYQLLDWRYLSEQYSAFPLVLGLVFAVRFFLSGSANGEHRKNSLSYFSGGGTVLPLTLIAYFAISNS